MSYTSRLDTYRIKMVNAITGDARKKEGFNGQNQGLVVIAGDNYRAR